MPNAGFRLGLLGHGISYSLSPEIFRWAFETTGVHGTYEILDLSPDELRRFLTSDVHRWSGLNVTIPHKTAVFTACANLSGDARLARAVNVLHSIDDFLFGENTDGSGFLTALTRAAGRREFQRALVIGAGGASRAVVAALFREFRAEEIDVGVREVESNAARILRMMCLTQRILPLAELGDDLSAYDLVVQATNVGLMANPGNPLPPTVTFRGDALVFDLIYSPRQTEFLKMAERQGVRTENGLSMLIAQAGHSFEIWTGAKFPFAEAFEQLPTQLANS